MLDDLHFLIFQNKTRHSPSYVTDKNRIKNSLVLFYHKNKGKVISLPPQSHCIFLFIYLLEICSAFLLLWSSKVLE